MLSSLPSAIGKRYKPRWIVCYESKNDAHQGCFGVLVQVETANLTIAKPAKRKALPYASLICYDKVKLVKRKAV
jgi:hypothetical protein